MSADDWTICPQCAVNKSEKEKAESEKLNKLYGEVPADQFAALMDDMRKRHGKGLTESLREDYEIGTDDGTFSVSYRCSCECGFSFGFKHNSEIFPEPPTPPTGETV